MADPRTIAALVAVSMAVSGCGLDALEGKKSDFQIEQERRSALTLPVATTAAAVDVAAVVDPEPPAPQVAPCEPEWRIYSCGPNGEHTEWQW